MKLPKAIRNFRKNSDVLGRAIRTMSKGFSPYKISVYRLLRERAVQGSADYAAQYLDTAMIFDQPSKLWSYAASQAVPSSGLILEFGVFKGRSINFLASIFDDQALYGFDSFEGLAEDWQGYHLPKGSFDLGGRLPKVKHNVTLIKGWFDATLPAFLAEHEGTIRLCHIDCDTYESARYVLDQIAPRLTSGSILIFDEYYGYPNWQKGEFLAWKEICAEKDIKYSYKAFANMQAAVIIH